MGIKIVHFFCFFSSLAYVSHSNSLVALTAMGVIEARLITAANVPRFAHGCFAVPDITHNGGYWWKVVFKT